MGLSVVIITRNEAHIIGNTLQSLQGVTDNIIIVDNGSTDDTIAICRKYKAHVVETKWEGYGITKNKGIDAASNDWILSLDADEAIDQELRSSLLQLDLLSDINVYELKYKNFFCNKWIRFGEWSGDKHIRLFNRNRVRWDDAPVHESLVMPGDKKIVQLKGNVLHYTVHSIDEYMGKTIHYSKLNAQKYFLQEKKAGYFKLYFGPGFNFLKHYIFELGFLDGFEGYLIAKTTAW
ncbi:MAG: glycosyltransferase family 2 protein, partial [Ferruginibacter sp.]